MSNTYEVASWIRWQVEFLLLLSSSIFLQQRRNLMNIITISREFGSGGREVGKRLADALGYGYYDREILTAMAQSTEMEESYLMSTE